MAISSMRSSICNSFLDNWDKIVNPIGMVKSQYLGYVNQFVGLLTGMPFSPTSLIDSALNTLYSAASNAIPGSSMDDLNELWNIMQNCLLLDGQSPISTIFGTTNGIFNIIDVTVDDLMGTVPEFGPGKFASLIDHLLNGMGIPGGQTISDLLKKADQLISCLEYQCGFYDPYYMTYVGSYSSYLNDLYSDLNVESDPENPNYGKFDYATIYNNLGLTIPEQNQMTRVIGGINSAKSMATTGVDDTVSAIKQAKRLGQIFP
jgi:hypothetical protein